MSALGGPSWEDEWGHLKYTEPVRAMLDEAGFADWKAIRLSEVETPKGPAYSLHVDTKTGAKISDEKLLEKLRTINGQEPFTYVGLPIFFCENLKP
jgi:hypothetical protein